MKLVYIIQSIYQRVVGNRAEQSSEYQWMDIATQRVENNPKIMLFRTDYLE